MEPGQVDGSGDDTRKRTRRPFRASPSTKIIGGEYFIGNDPGQGAGHSSPRGRLVRRRVGEQFASDLGPHASNFTGRAQDRRSVPRRGRQWSPVGGRIWLSADPNPLKPFRGLRGDLSIIGGEYFIGNDPGGALDRLHPTGRNLFDDESGEQFASELDLSSLAVGEHRIGVRYRDGAGNWSPVTWDDLVVIYPQTPTAEAVPGSFADQGALRAENILSGTTPDKARAPPSPHRMACSTTSRRAVCL